MEAQEIINHISVLSYFGVWLVSYAANVIIPIPEEGVLIILGYLAGSPKFDIFLLFPVVVAGTLASDITIYLLARSGNKIVTRVYNQIFATKVESKIDWIKNHIGKVIFFSRFMIQLRFLGPFLAGHLRVPFKKFLYLDFLALCIYVPIYLFLGFYFRGRIEAMLSGIGVVKNLVFTVLILVALFVTLRYIRLAVFKAKSLEWKFLKSGNEEEPTLDESKQN